MVPDLRDRHYGPLGPGPEPRHARDDPEAGPGQGGAGEGQEKHLRIVLKS